MPVCDQDRGNGMINNNVLYRFHLLMVTCLYFLVSGANFCLKLVYLVLDIPQDVLYILAFC